MKTHFTYSVDEYTYWLIPVFKVTPSGYIRVKYAAMYTPLFKNYMGVWERYNMPMAVVMGLESKCRFEHKRGNTEQREDGDWIIKE